MAKAMADRVQVDPFSTLGGISVIDRESTNGPRQISFKAHLAHESITMNAIELMNELPCMGNRSTSLAIAALSNEPMEQSMNQ